MSKRYVLSLLGADRTGILAAVATALSELGGDIHEVNQTIVSGLFTMTLAADFPEARPAEVIVGHLEGVCRPFGLKVLIKDPKTESLQEKLLPQRENFSLLLTGCDAPGIVAKISGCLARETIDVTELRGSRRQDGRSFALLLQLAVPFGVDAARLQAELVEIGVPYGLTVRLAPDAGGVTTSDS